MLWSACADYGLTRRLGLAELVISGDDRRGQEIILPSILAH
jgi:hypothetical protein